VEWTYRHPDGVLRHLLCNMFPMFGPENAIMGAISTHVDITERKEYEQQVARYTLEQARQKRELEEANAKLEALATTDGLTGLKNHRAFQERLALQIECGVVNRLPLSVMMLDVDHFKQFNDAFGHPIGDQVLKKLGALLQSNSRATDFVARYGGEEFVILLMNTGPQTAAEVAERIRVAVERQPWEHRPITVSIGIASAETPNQDLQGLVERADQALYASKARGRNCVTHAFEIEIGLRSAS
jgi:diguanylate cyclase (GGDEF)-like protein